MNSIGGQKAFVIAHASEVSAARRHGTELANRLGFSETEAGRLAIIVTEAATNLLKHAQEGLLLLNCTKVGATNAIEVLALDRGPGITSLAQSLRDGISTAGTAGTGLGAMRRQADQFDAYSQPGKGSAFYMRVDAGAGSEATAAPALLEIGTVCQPIAGEDECGDAWAIAQVDGGATVLVADGLGHGPEAATASNAAVHALDRAAGSPPEALIQALHQALRPTRGAAAAVAQLRFANGASGANFADGELRFAGIGNISACIIDGQARKQLVSHNGIVGHNMRKVQEFSLPWQNDSLCIMCSDGITTQWDLGSYPGLASCHPVLIAGVIFRDFRRDRDDATVVVVRQKAAS